MQANGIVTFTTDFGNRDPYAGIMKGIVLGANPHARIVDITHEIPAHNILNAAFSLVRTCRYFPEGTIHVAIVDPGVGGRRKNIAVRTDQYFFIGPDNGILSPMLSNVNSPEIRVIENPPFIKSIISDTFHGRDVFAPCAGHLSAGNSFAEVGPETERIKHLIYPKATCEANILKGEIVSIDYFGNMITNISKQNFREFVGKRKFEIYFGSERFTKILRHYNDIEQGSPLILFGSSCYMEISMNEGNAADYFMSSVGSPVTIRRF